MLEHITPVNVTVRNPNKYIGQKEKKESRSSENQESPRFSCFPFFLLSFLRSLPVLLLAKTGIKEREREKGKKMKEGGSQLLIRFRMQKLTAIICAYRHESLTRLNKPQMERARARRINLVCFSQLRSN